MKKLVRFFLAITLAVCVVSSPARANLVTIDPDDYAPGTMLSNVIPGVALSVFSDSYDRPYSFSDVYAGHDPACISNPYSCDAITGSKGFSPRSDGLSGSRGWFDAGAAANCFTQVLSASCSSFGVFSALLVSFENPTNYVEISGAFYSDNPDIWAFDANRNMLGKASDMIINFREPNYNYNTATTRFQSATSNVAYIVAAGWSSNTSLDVLRYNDANSVPEPGSVALFGLGLVGLVLAQRRKKLALPKVL